MQRTPKPMKRARIYIYPHHFTKNKLSYRVQVGDGHGNLNTVATLDTLPAARKYMQDNGYIEAHKPYMTPEAITAAMTRK